MVKDIKKPVDFSSGKTSVAVMRTRDVNIIGLSIFLINISNNPAAAVDLRSSMGSGNLLTSPQARPQTVGHDQ